MSGLAVPEADGAQLIAPSLEEIAPHLQRGPVSLPRPDLQLIRDLARSEVRDLARHYLSYAGEPLPATGGDLILMAGHQPELFHPGVWLKNFVLSRLARQHRALPVNLLVDNDHVKTTALAVPHVELPLPPVLEARPRVVPVPLDRVEPGMPFEEWRVREEDYFSALPTRVMESAAIERKSPATDPPPEVDDVFLPPTAGPRRPASEAFHIPDPASRNPDSRPLLGPFWEEVRRQYFRSRNVPDRMAAARRTFERRWGCHNLEVPVSQVCRSQAFDLFTLDLLRELPRFHEVFNEAVRAYRRLHHLRSKHHPFPELTRDGDWLETPFWTWKKDQPDRRRLFVKRGPDGLVLRRGKEPGAEVPLRAHWAENRVIEANEWKVRPRALTTTLFARLFVADLFIHGLGGAKYDAVTDEVIRRYYGVEPPPYLVVTGTLRLPLPTYPTVADDLRRLTTLLRDMEFNPQRYLARDDRTAELLDRRREWVERAPTTPAGRLEKRGAIRQINEELGAFFLDRRQELESQRDQWTEELRANTLLRRRDWAFPLYPESKLREFLTRSDS